jgi:hypothetical protein
MHGWEEKWQGLNMWMFSNTDFEEDCYRWYMIFADNFSKNSINLEWKVQMTVISPWNMKKKQKIIKIETFYDMW